MTASPTTTGVGQRDAIRIHFGSRLKLQTHVEGVKAGKAQGLSTASHQLALEGFVPPLRGDIGRLGVVRCILRSIPAPRAFAWLQSPSSRLSACWAELLPLRPVSGVLRAGSLQSVSIAELDKQRVQQQLGYIFGHNFFCCLGVLATITTAPHNEGLPECWSLLLSSCAAIDPRSCSLRGCWHRGQRVERGYEPKTLHRAAQRG